MLINVKKGASLIVICSRLLLFMLLATFTLTLTGGEKGGESQKPKITHRK